MLIQYTDLCHMNSKTGKHIHYVLKYKESTFSVTK